MATMIPEDIEQFTTDGEKQVYSFLENVAKPDADYTVWYSPDISGREPDFVLYNKDIGLVIFEVKDWALDQIREADKKQFRLQIGSKVETRKNPAAQARDYVFACKEAIEKDGELISPETGNPRVWISHGVILTNINKLEFVEKSLGSIVDVDSTFFWDDLHPASPVSEDSTGQVFHKLMVERFAPPFQSQLTGKENVHLKQLIFPVVRIEQPRKQVDSDFSSLETHISSLDHHQETLARKYDGGHHILKGSSGCGKTLILACKAAFLLRYNPLVKSVLFVCFNITLVRYIKRILAQKQVPLGKNGVEVVHFYELCNRITGDKVDFEGQDQDYYQIILDDALEASKEYQKYDAVLIDEGQDFSDDMYRVMMNLINPTTDSLTIALDEKQNIYARSRNWKELGIHARGRTHTIKYIYRSTKELTEFAARFAAGGIDEQENKRPKQTQLFPGYFDFHGPKPNLNQYSSLSELLEAVVQEINRLVTEKKYLLSEIAILYLTSKIEGEQNTVSLPERIGAALDENGLIYDWVSQDYRAKKSYDVTTDSVTISTVHSVKGFDYAAVFVVGLDMLDKERWTEEQVKRLAYVAISRARFRMYVPYVNTSEIVQDLQRCVK